MGNENYKFDSASLFLFRSIQRFHLQSYVGSAIFRNKNQLNIVERLRYDFYEPITDKNLSQIYEDDNRNRKEIDEKV